jgi:hypothetical protein
MSDCALVSIATEAAATPTLSDQTAKSSEAKSIFFGILQAWKVNCLLITTEAMSQSYSRHEHLCDPSSSFILLGQKHTDPPFYCLQIPIDPAHNTRGKPK